MSRCVDLDERVTAQFYDEECEEWTMQTCTIADVLDSVCDEYTVLHSAQPERKNGHWIYYNDGNDEYYECSVCGDAFELVEGNPKENNYNFCPNCGARMGDL